MYDIYSAAPKHGRVAPLFWPRLNTCLVIVALTVVHADARYCTAMRHYGALTCGLSSKWWSEKHNLHHAFTNVIGADEDIIVSVKSYDTFTFYVALLLYSCAWTSS